MLTTKEFATELGVKYPTVMGWLREGRLPEAEFDDSNPRGGVWYIPRSALIRFKNEETRPRRGRPSKKSEAV
jgi:excisionase family DNA binding protein